MKKKIILILRTAVFLCILLFLFTRVTYLFRRDDESRIHVMGIKSETEPLDMVYVGGSAAFVYYEPMKAWHDYGYASYVMGTNSVQPENIIFYMKEVMKYQEPEVFVVDLRPFEYYETAYSDENYAGFRNGCDALDIGPLRNEMIEYHITKRSMPLVPPMTEYLDIVFYKDNKAALGNPNNWHYSKNTTTRLPYRGFEFYYEYAPVDVPDFETEEKNPMHPEAEAMMTDLLDYCDEQELNVLFVVCPYHLSTESQKTFNAIEEIITDRGYDYLNANEHYADMNLNFANDFYNVNHVNCFGAEKYTEFLSRYIDEKYDLPDHRMEDDYKSWNDDYAKFKEEEIKAKDYILNLKNKEKEVNDK